MPKASNSAEPLHQLEGAQSNWFGVHGKHARIEALLHQSQLHIAMRRIVPQVVELVGVGLQVVEFSLIGAMVDNDLCICCSQHGSVSITMRPTIEVLAIDMLAMN